MKKLIPILILAILIMFSGVLVLSAEVCPPDTICNPLGATSFQEIIDSVISFIFYVALVVVPLMIVIGGFYIMTAGDDSEKVKKGKQIIFYTMIGLFIVLFARGLISVLKGVMGVKTGT